MSWIDLILASVKYGPSILILLIMAIFLKPFYKWMKGINKKQLDTDQRLRNCEEKMDSVHDGCHIPIGAMKKVEKKIEQLEAKDTQIEVDITGIRTKLDSVEIMTRQIHDHFLGEGLRAGRRGDD